MNILARAETGGWLARQSAEFRLLVEATSGRGLATPPPEPIDWAAFHALAIRHGLISLAYRSLGDDTCPWVPAEVRQSMRDELRARTTRNLGMAAETLHICRALADADVPHVVLKGAAVGEVVYGNAGLRDSVDIDILVPVELAVRCLGIFGGLGFGSTMQPKPGPGLSPVRRFITKDWRFKHFDTGALVELHWRLNENPFHLPLPPEWWRQTSTSGEGRFPHLPPILWALFLACHGAQSHYTQLKWLTDLHHILSRFPELTPEALYAAGQAHDVSRPVRQTLALLNLIYGVNVPPDRGREGNVMRYLVADSLSSIESPEPMDAARSLRRGVEVARRLRYRMTLVTGWRHRVFELFRPLWRWLNI